jgi:predicted outer membrane repeat protein
VYVANGSAALSGGQIFSNTASANGGGIYNLNGMLTLVNTTLSGNRAGAQGGGLYHNGGVSVLTYTTVASNTAYTGGGGIRGGSAITLQNSIVANNNAANCAGALTSNGHNLDSGATCGFAASGDITSANPLFGPPVKDSGTLVHPLLKGSPAIIAGICVAEITADQRGVSRPQGDGCDIGAYEFAEYTIYLPLVLNN